MKRKIGTIYCSKNVILTILIGILLCFSIESMRSAHQLELSQELQRIKTNHKLQEQQWANKEYDYKKRIQQLETKVCNYTVELFL